LQLIIYYVKKLLKVELTLSTNVVIILISQPLPMCNKLSESLIPKEQ